MHIKKLHKKFKANKKPFRRFITALEESKHTGIVGQAKTAEKEVWEEVDCLTCANCCKKMTPTLNETDKTRIATHLGLSGQQFTEAFLAYDKQDKDWRMQSQPCYFLDEATNKCRIYAIRPADCLGFPHLTKMPLKSYLYIHKQNIKYCPATYKFIEKLMERIEIIKV